MSRREILGLNLSKFGVKFRARNFGTKAKFSVKFRREFWSKR